MIGYVKPFDNLINFVATNVIPNETDVEVDFTEDLINEINQPKSLSLDGMQQGNIYLYNLDGSINVEQQAFYDDYLSKINELSLMRIYTQEENNAFQNEFDLFIAGISDKPLSAECKMWKNDNYNRSKLELAIKELLDKLQPE